MNYAQEIIHKKIYTNIPIPAYNNKGSGLTIDVHINAQYCESFSVEANGNIADALRSHFIRVVEVMASIKKSWEVLMKFNYVIDSNNKLFNVKDVRSSGLALSIALLNIYREFQGIEQVMSITGSGLLRIDGSFEETYYEEVKSEAVNKKQFKKMDFITSNCCDHIFDLENFINSTLVNKENM